MSMRDTLKQRKSIYGKYDDALKLRAHIMNLLKDHYKRVNRKPMPQEYETGFHDLVIKLVRAAGKPEYKDSFHDLAGYATLMEGFNYETE